MSQNDKAVSKAQGAADGAAAVNNDQSTRLSALEKAATATAGGVSFVRRGKVVVATLDGSSRKVASWSGVTLCTIPKGFRSAARAEASATSAACQCVLRAEGSSLYLIARGAVDDVAVNGQVEYATGDA